MSWWNNWRKRKKIKLENLCHVCGVNQLPDEPAVLRLQVQDGIAEMNVCDECADFFDRSAELLGAGRPRLRDKSEDNDEPI